MSEHNKINMEELTASGDERFRWIGNTVLSYLKRIESLEKDNEYINSVEERLTRVETWIKGEPSLKGLEKRIDEIRNSITIHRVGDKLSHMKNIQVEFGKRIDTHWEVNQETMKRVSEVEKLKESVDLFAPPVIDEFRKRFDALEKKLDNAQYEYWNITRPVFMMHCQEFFERVSALEVFRLNMVDDNKVLIDNDLDASKRMVLLEASCASHTHEKKRHLTTTSKASPPPNTPVLEGSDDTKSNEKFSGDLVDGKGGSGNPIRDAVFNVLKDGEPKKGCSTCGHMCPGTLECINDGFKDWKPKKSCGTCKSYMESPINDCMKHGEDGEEVGDDVHCRIHTGNPEHEVLWEPRGDLRLYECDDDLSSLEGIYEASKVDEIVKGLRDKVTGLNNLVDVGIREQESLREQLTEKERKRDAEEKRAERLVSRIFGLEKQLDNKTRSYNESLESVKRLEEQLAAKEEIITHSFRRVDVDAMKDDLKGKIEELEKERDGLKSDHVSMRDEVIKLQQERGSLLGNINHLEEERDECQLKVGKYESIERIIDYGNIPSEPTEMEKKILKLIENGEKAAKWDKTVMVGMENEGYEIRVYNPEGMKIVNKILDKEKALDDITPIVDLMEVARQVILQLPSDEDDWVAEDESECERGYLEILKGVKELKEFLDATGYAVPKEEKDDEE